MPTTIKLLIDEDVHLALAEALRRRGHDAVHVREVERLGLDDECQLKFAAHQRRCFVTFNVGELSVPPGTIHIFVTATPSFLEHRPLSHVGPFFSAAAAA